MPFFAGFVYYLGIFIVYSVAIFGAVKLGVFMRKKKNASAAVEQ